MAEEVIRNFGEIRLRVYGTSMLPTILPGDFVLIHRATVNEISPGEIVLYLQRGRLFVHRVVDRKEMAASSVSGELHLITRGDRLRHNDPPVSSLELLGRVVSIERDGQEIELPANGSNRIVVRLLQSSDRAAYLYLRLAEYWRTLFTRRAKCLV